MLQAYDALCHMQAQRSDGEEALKAAEAALDIAREIGDRRLRSPPAARDDFGFKVLTSDDPAERTEGSGLKLPMVAGPSWPSSACPSKMS